MQRCGRARPARPSQFPPTQPKCKKMPVDLLYWQGAKTDNNLRASRWRSAGLAQRRLHELHRIVARPFGGSGEGADLAAVRIDQERRRHAEGATDHLEVLEHLGVRIGVIGKPLYAHVLEPC